MPDTVNHFPPQSKTQRAKILRLLLDAKGSWVPLPEILACAAQYNARIFELRKRGFNIENRTELIEEVRHSWFRLIEEHPTLDKVPTDWCDRPRSTGLPLWDAVHR